MTSVSDSEYIVVNDPWQFECEDVESDEKRELAPQNQTQEKWSQHIYVCESAVRVVMEAFGLRKQEVITLLDSNSGDYRAVVMQLWARHRQGSYRGLEVPDICRYMTKTELSLDFSVQEMLAFQRSDASMMHEDRIKCVMIRASCTRQRAVAALQSRRNNVVDAILSFC